MRTFPSAIFRMIGRVEVAGLTRKCALCDSLVDLDGHESDCPVLAALNEANKIAEEMTQPTPASPIVYPTGVRGIEFPGPATCRSTTGALPIDPQCQTC